MNIITTVRQREIICNKGNGILVFLIPDKSEDDFAQSLSELLELNENKIVTSMSPFDSCGKRTVILVENQR
jgi:hypothetical protein